MSKSRRSAAGQPAPAVALPRRRLLVAIAAGALVVGGGTAYLERDTAGPAAVSAGSAQALPPLEVETGVVHIHGLGVDPADGVLYAATHSGLFRLPSSGPAVRVANRAQDTMGFSVVGPRTFIGSGHPDTREDDVRPPLLGLLESTDAGQSWARLSLHGQADFHALHAAHGQVYGYDSTSQTFMVSKDRTVWDRRAQLPMRDFAVSPADAGTVLATTGSGLQRGTTGGQPEAIAVDSRNGATTLYVAVAERGILASTDGAKTFTTRYQQ